MDGGMMGRWMGGGMDGQMDGWRHGWIDGWVKEWMDRWVGRRMDEQLMGGGLDKCSAASHAAHLLVFLLGLSQL